MTFTYFAALGYTDVRRPHDAPEEEAGPEGRQEGRPEARQEGRGVGGQEEARGAQGGEPHVAADEEQGDDAEREEEVVVQELGHGRAAGAQDGREEGREGRDVREETVDEGRSIASYRVEIP